MAWDLLGNLSGNPYAEGGSRFSPTGQYWGWLPAAGANYDPSFQGFNPAGPGNNYAFMNSGNMGLQPSWGPGHPDWNQAPAQRRGFGNPLADLFGSWDKLFGGGGGPPSTPAMSRSSPFGNFQYTTGIGQQGALSNADRDAGIAAIRGVKGGRPPATGGPLSANQAASLTRQMQDVASTSGGRLANDFMDNVNAGEAGLRLGQSAAAAEAGNRAQQFANRRQAHKLNQQNAVSDIQFGLLGDLLGGMFGGLGGLV
jgi:hypothetical protein